MCLSVFLHLCLICAHQKQTSGHHVLIQAPNTSGKSDAQDKYHPQSPDANIVLYLLCDLPQHARTNNHMAHVPRASAPFSKASTYYQQHVLRLFPAPIARTPQQFASLHVPSAWLCRTFHWWIQTLFSGLIIFEWLTWNPQCCGLCDLADKQQPDQKNFFLPLASFLQTGACVYLFLKTHRLYKLKMCVFHPESWRLYNFYTFPPGCLCFLLFPSLLIS